MGGGPAASRLEAEPFGCSKTPHPNPRHKGGGSESAYGPKDIQQIQPYRDSRCRGFLPEATMKSLRRRILIVVA